MLGSGMVNVSRKDALIDLEIQLKEIGYEVTESALESCFDRVRDKFRFPGWCNMSPRQKEEILLKVKNKQIANIHSDKHRPKKWVMDEAVYTSRELYHLVKQHLGSQESEIQLPTEQNFGRRLKRLKESGSDVITQDGVIASHAALLDSTTNFAKTAPCTIYQIDFIRGPHTGKKYVGTTQSTVSERVRWHFSNATRPESSQKNPNNRLYKALRDSLDFSNDRESWLSTGILNSDVKLENAKAAESDHCEIVAAAIGKENLLNVATPGSIGGRSGTKRVIYKGREYCLYDGVRAVAKDQEVSDEDTAKFSGKFLYHFRQQAACDQFALDAVAERFARIGSRGGQLYRRDAIQYRLNEKRVCIREAANITGREPDQIRSLLRNRHVLGVENADLTQILSGSIPRIPIKTPGTVHFFQNSDDITEDLRRKIERVQNNCNARSWRRVATYLEVKESTLRARARRFEHDIAGFWTKVLSR